MWPSPESQREKREFLMVAPGQDPPGRHSNEALLLEALDEFDAVESTPLKLCRPSLQNSQDDIRGSIGDGSRLDLNKEIVSTASDVSKGVRLGGGHRASWQPSGGGEKRFSFLCSLLK